MPPLFSKKKYDTKLAEGDSYINVHDAGKKWF